MKMDDGRFPLNEDNTERLAKTVAESAEQARLALEIAWPKVIAAFEAFGRAMHGER